MTNEQLQELRTKILGDILPLVVESSDDADKFDIILRLIQSGRSTPELFQRAYEAAVSFPDTDQKLDALMALLDEVEVSLDDEQDEAGDSPSASNSASAEEESVTPQAETAAPPAGDGSITVRTVGTAAGA